MLVRFCLFILLENFHTKICLMVKFHGIKFCWLFCHFLDLSWLVSLIMCAKNSVTPMRWVQCKPYYAGQPPKFLALSHTTPDIFGIRCIFPSLGTAHLTKPECWPLRDQSIHEGSFGKLRARLEKMHVMQNMPGIVAWLHQEFQGDVRDSRTFSTWQIVI